MFPNGFTPVLATMVAVSFAFSGTELIGIAAGESENPERDVPKSIRNIVWRTFFFFIGAIFVLSALIPWKEAGVTESPFVTVFARIGIPYAAEIMNFVILTALLSIANSGLYACARRNAHVASRYRCDAALPEVPWNPLMGDFLGKAVVDGEMRYGSVSAVKTFDSGTRGGCARRWWFSKIGGKSERAIQRGSSSKSLHAHSS